MHDHFFDNQIVERYFAILPKENSGTDTVAIFALVISIFTLAFTYYGFFLSKKLEIKHGIFNEIIIKQFDVIFDSFKKKVDNNLSKKNSSIINEVNELSNSIDIHIVNLDNVYYKFQMDNLIIIKEEFCDYFFENPTEPIRKCKDRVYTYRNKIKIELYRELELQFSLLFIIKKYCSANTYKDLYNNLRKL